MAVIVMVGCSQEARLDPIFHPGQASHSTSVFSAWESPDPPVFVADEAFPLNVNLMQPLSSD